MKMLWKLTKEAARYKGLYILAILSTLALTAVNLTAPKVLSAMTGIVESGFEQTSFSVITTLTLILLGLYLLRILFRFLSNYLAHKAAWYLVGDLRSRMYDKLQSLDLGFFHDKQTGDLACYQIIILSHSAYAGVWIKSSNDWIFILHILSSLFFLYVQKVLPDIIPQDSLLILL